jgi:hypothetical protein
MRASLNELYHAGIRAYPQLNNDALNAILRTQAMASLPPVLRTKMLDFQGKIEELRKVNPLIPPMEWATFVEKATEYANVLEEKDRSRLVKEVHSHRKEPNSNAMLVEQITQAMEKFTVPETPSVQYIDSGQHAITDSIIGAIQQGFSNSQPRTFGSPHPNATYPNNVMPERKRRTYQGYTMYHIGDEKFSENARTIRQPVREHLNMQNLFNTQKRKKVQREVKTVNNPNAKIPYVWVGNKYIPQAEAIDFPVLVETAPKKFTITDTALAWAETHCPFCGETFCGSNAVGCIYAKNTQNFDACNKCKRGFHMSDQCKAHLKN